MVSIHQKVLHVLLALVRLSCTIEPWSRKVLFGEASSSLYSILREVVEDAVPVVIRPRGIKMQSLFPRASTIPSLKLPI